MNIFDRLDARLVTVPTAPVPSTWEKANELLMVPRWRVTKSGAAIVCLSCKARVEIPCSVPRIKLDIITRTLVCEATP